MADEREVHAPLGAGQRMAGARQQLCCHCPASHLAQQRKRRLERARRHQQASGRPGPPLCCRHMHRPALHGCCTLGTPAASKRGARGLIA